MATALDREGTSRRLLVETALRIGVGAGITYLLYLGAGAFGLAFAAPVVGLLLAKPIVEWIALIPRSAAIAAADAWDGDIVVFQEHQLRVAFVAGFPWIVDRELLAVLGRAPAPVERRRADAAHYAELPNQRLWAFSEAGVKALLAASNEQPAHKLLVALERQVFFPARKRRGRAEDERINAYAPAAQAPGTAADKVHETPR